MQSTLFMAFLFSLEGKLSEEKIVCLLWSWTDSYW